MNHWDCAGEYLKIKDKTDEDILSLRRVDDSYCADGPSADAVANARGLVVQKVDGVRLCSVPEWAITDAIAHLFRSGHRPAICQSDDTPRFWKDPVSGGHNRS